MVITLCNVCSVHWGIFNTSGGVQYIGDTMSTSEGYLEYIGGDIMIHVGEQIDTIL